MAYLAKESGNTNAKLDQLMLMRKKTALRTKIRGNEIKVLTNNSSSDNNGGLKNKLRS
jgi:hypothetical protein